MVALKNWDGPGDEATYLLLQAKIVSYIVSLSTHGRLPGTLQYTSIVLILCTLGVMLMTYFPTVPLNPSTIDCN